MGAADFARLRNTVNGRGADGSRMAYPKWIRGSHAALRVPVTDVVG